MSTRSRLTVTGPGGSNTQTRSNYITVSAAAPLAQFTGSPVSGTFPLTVAFSNTSSGSITSYAWDFGDGTTSTAASPSKVYAAAGVYTVKLTVTGPGGSNTQTRSNYIVVVSKPLDIAVYRGSGSYSFMVNFDADPAADATIPFGIAGDKPLVGNVTPGGKTSFIVYRKGVWYIDSNRHGIADIAVGFGDAWSHIPLTGNFSGPGATDSLVIYSNGTWLVDDNLDGRYDRVFSSVGAPGDIPLVGDVNGDGIDDLIIYRNGVWYVSTRRDGVTDLVFYYGGLPGDVPLLFDWDGDGKADLCIFRAGVWLVSTKRDGQTDVTFSFGAAGDQPFTGTFH